MYTSINKSRLQRPNKDGGNVPNSNCSQSLMDFPTDDEGDRFGASSQGLSFPVEAKGKISI